MGAKRLLVLTFSALTLLAATAWAGNPGQPGQGGEKSAKDYSKLPGYVEFATLDIFGQQEPKVEIYLEEPLIDLVSKFVQSEDEELYSVLRKLKLVRVQVFEVTEELAAQFIDRSAKAVKNLDKQGWQRIVRVKDEGENAYIYLKPAADYQSIDGILVIAVEEGENEAVFVNIVGNINPDDVSRLGGHFNIEELDSIRYEVKQRN
jgi:hypothetical protein